MKRHGQGAFLDHQEAGIAEHAEIVQTEIELKKKNSSLCIATSPKLTTRAAQEL